jgi:para-aminobenzoate synthetase/4-amino-4-deoxychorismate lyase
MFILSRVPPLSPSADSILLHEARANRWLLFERPQAVIQTFRPEEVTDKLREVEEAVATRGLHAAGLLAYEAAPGFDPSLAVRPDSTFPLLWFGLYDAPRAVDIPLFAEASSGPEDLWNSAFARDDYVSAFEHIKRRIKEGDTYQVNLTYRLQRAFAENPWPVFVRMAAAQGPAFGAFITTRDWTVCSASPELFFRLDGTRLESRPMKGTAPRGLTLSQDRDQAAALRTSEKNRAENLMIVDMVRNDMGRIAEPGSVSVPHLFDLEKYPTVWQMTSTVCADTHAPVTEIVRALFPPASITGAPKARTMQLIAEIETTPRRVYTGSVGFIAPGRHAQFNVAIRTLLVDHTRNQAEYGVGGGIVWDSVCSQEQAECRTKTRILDTYTPPFSLLETLLWTPADGYTLFERHLARLKDSAEYFDYTVDLAAVRQRLCDLALGLPQAPYRIRLLVAQDGSITLEAEPLVLPSDTAPRPVALARHPVDRADPFLYHKTTHRRVYAEALASRPGFDDVILFNADGEITESTRMNVVAEIEGALCTPPVSCGLLPGTFRAHLLETGVVTERVITIDELLASPRFFLVNSVRGMTPVTVSS